MKYKCSTCFDTIYCLNDIVFMKTCNAILNKHSVESNHIVFELHIVSQMQKMFQSDGLWCELQYNFSSVK